MRILLRSIDTICTAGAIFAALAIAGISVMLIAEVILTSRFNWSQPWVVEFSGYGLAAALFAGSGWALRQGGHIRVTIVFQALPTTIQRIVDAICTLCALVVTLYAAQALSAFAQRSAELGSVSTYLSRTPLVYPQAMLAMSFVILALALIARLLRLLIGEDPEMPKVTSTQTEAKSA